MKNKWVKGLALFYCLAWIMVLAPMNCYAYIDPSITTYAIQVIAGIIIAVGAVAGIYWRKAKKKISKTMGIDENKNKIVEDDIVEIDEETPDKDITT